ncbi:MAG: hypothetical protein RL026_1950 [Pseudomonadota bacterium]|jgi:hypothetical protein
MTGMRVGRELEERILQQVAAGSTDRAAWQALGPASFVAGLLQMLAGLPVPAAPAWARLAEELQPGIGRAADLEAWLATTPLKPARLMPMVRARLAHAG